MTEYKYSGGHHEASHEYLFPTVNSLLSILPSGSSVLDLGCGNGSFISLFRERGWKLYGTDSSTTGIEIAQRNYPGIEFFCADAEREIAGQFDAVISTEVIEHVYNPRAFVRTAYGLLKPGGILILTTPYHGYLKNLVMAVSGRLDRHFTVLWDNGHIKFWSRATLTQVVREVGLVPLRFRGSGRAPYLWNSMALMSQKPYQ